MPARNVGPGVLACSRSLRTSLFLNWVPPPLDERKIGREKFEYFLVSCLSLVGKKQVTRVLEQHEFCARNPCGNQFPIARGHQRIGLSMDDQRRHRDLRESAI